jgi:hypothetical protein
VKNIRMLAHFAENNLVYVDFLTWRLNYEGSAVPGWRVLEEAGDPD